MEKMKEEILPAPFHKIFRDDNSQHDRCSDGDMSWCLWQNALNELTDYKQIVDVFNSIKYAYEDDVGLIY